MSDISKCKGLRDISSGIYDVCSVKETCRRWRDWESGWQSWIAMSEIRPCPNYIPYVPRAASV